VNSLNPLETIIDKGFEKIIDRLSEERERLLGLLKSHESFRGLNSEQK